jgi:alpha-methylacyl-CoA racemase
VQGLAGVRVLDLSRLLPGPFATGVLADMGAEVDKIEDPHQGDYLRGLPPMVGGQNAAFAILNRGKRSGVLDLKDPRGVDALRKILPRYDVLFEQFRPGVLARLGLAPEALMQQHPRLIVCSLTGYGQTGPMRDRAGHDLNYLARAGLLGATGPEEGIPFPPGFQVADVSGGLWSVIAILGALRERDRTGKGAHLDIAMSEGTLPFAIMSIANALAGAGRAHGSEVLTGGIAPYCTYRTKDGRAVALSALEPKFWIAFGHHAGVSASLEDLMPGPHQATKKSELEKLFAERTLAEWVAWAEGKDVLLEPVLTPDEAIADAHLVARRMFVDGPNGRTLRTPVTPVEAARKPSPNAGEHTREILRDGGLADDAIAQLVEARVARGS